jgi:FMN phosphatase YigB (HAD superfamily)
MNKPKILVDMDGTWYDWHKAVHTELFIHDKISCSYYDFWKTKYKEYNEMYWQNIIRVPFLYSTQIPSHATLETFDKLDKCFEIYHVTARPIEVQQVTINYLKRYNIPQRENLFFDSRKGLFANAMGIEFGVDDQLKHIKDLTANGVKVTGVRMPYNEDEIDTLGIGVITNFSEIEGILL